MSGQRPRTPPTVVIGVLLIIGGAIALLVQVVDVDVTRFWPLLVLIPGVALLAVGLALAGGPGRGLSIAGAITLTAGLVLSFQEVTGAFETWAYLWALVAPGGVGVGLLAHALAHGDRRARTAGMRTLVTGLALFAVFFAIFEGVIGLSGWDLGIVGDIVLPVLIITVGVVLLLRARSGADPDGG